MDNKEHKSISWQRKKKPATHLRVLKHLRKKSEMLNIEQMVYTEGGRKKTSEF